MARTHRACRPKPRPGLAGLWTFLVIAFLFLGVLFAPPVRAGGSDPTPGSLVVKLVPGLTTEEQAAVITRNGGTETSSVPALRLHVVSVPAADLPAVLQAYKADPQVESAELNTVRKAEGAPSDQNYAYQWALPRIGWDAAFGTVVPAGTAKVALLDTGVDASHPDLAGALLPGKSMLDASNGWTDPSGHGTWMAGIVAASTNNGPGIAGVGYQGVSILPVVVLNASGLGQDSAIIEGIVWAADQGADVIFMPFSNPDYSQGLQDALDYAWSKGAVLVAATGNDGLSTPTYPAGGRGVVGVSATDPNDLILPLSNFGQDTFLAAPGMEILTTTANQTYATITGTSASSAVVAGTAAFLKAVDPTLTNGVIVGRMARSADAAGVAGDPNNTTLYGNGRVNFAKALADTSLLPIQPVGVPGGGGPYVGPYTAAAYHVTSLVLGGQSGSPVYGTAGAASFPLTVNGNGNGSLTPTFDGLPSGVNGTLSNTSFSGGSKLVTLTLTTGASAPAGSYTFAVILDGVRSNAGTLVIVKGQATVILADLNPTYTGSPLTPTATTVPAGLTIAWTGAPQTNAGSYPVTATVNDVNYEGSASGTFTIGKASSITAVTIVGGPFAYTGSALTPATVTVTGAGGLSLTPAPTYADNMNAGTATASYTFAGDANHTGSSDSKTFTIDKAPSVTTVTIVGGPFTYTGSTQMPATVSVTGAGGLNLTPAATYTNNVNAGTATASYTFTGDANHTGSSDSKTFTIDKATSVTTVAIVGGPFTYSGSALTPATVSVTGAGGLNLTPAATYTNNVNAGTATASYTFTGDANHTGSSDSKTFTIDKAPSTTTVTIVGGPFTYSGSALTPATVSVTGAGGLNLTPAATYTNNVNAGTATASYTFAGDANHTGSSDSKTFTIDKAPSVTAVTIVGGPFTYTGSALTPATVAVTGAGGLSLTPAAAYANNIDAGTATASYTFAGDANHTGSSDSKTFTIDKAHATVTLGDLNPTYTGSPLTPTATTVPAGLTLTWTGTPQTNAGSYPVTATVNDANYEGSASGTFIINKAHATVTLGDLNPTYTGSSLMPTATTVPASLALTWTGTPQTNAGSYPVTATVNDANYEGSASGTFVINKAHATVTLGNLNPTYTGSPLTPTATTVPAGLTVAWTGAPQTNAGSYPVTATVNDANYEGSASGSFIINKAAATLSLGTLTFTFDGNPKAVSPTTAPSGLSGVSVTYNGVATAPTNAGSYTVVASLSHPNYQASDVTGTLVIRKATAGITLGNLTQGYTGGALAPTATTVPSGLALVWTGTPQTSPGTYAVTATVNDPNYEGSASGTFAIIYGFNGLLSPYTPDKSYKIKSAIPLKWQYTNASGGVVPSTSAAPVISIAMILAGGTAGADIVLDDAGASGYQYDATTNTWQFNWKTTGLQPGTYVITIRSGATGQVNGTYPVLLAR